MTRSRAAIVLACALAGCTHRQLTRSTVATAGTVVDTQYRIILDNLAHISASPESLPSHIDLADGVVQVNDQGAFGTSGGLTTFGGTVLGIDRFGPSATRQITEQWGADATTDPQRIAELQTLYRAALGLPRLPTLNTVEYLRRLGESTGPGGKSAGSGGAPSPASTGGGGSTPGGGSGSSADGGRHVPIDILLSDVPPPGWYHLGCRRDVPRDACYVGRHGDRYAWVTADGVPGLSRFAITVLAVVKYQPGGSSGKSRGLAVTN